MINRRTPIREGREPDRNHAEEIKKLAEEAIHFTPDMSPSDVALALAFLEQAHPMVELNRTISETEPYVIVEFHSPKSEAGRNEAQIYVMRALHAHLPTIMAIARACAERDALGLKIAELQERTDRAVEEIEAVIARKEASKK